MSTQLQYDDDDNGLFTNKSTMMANFEEWIKMATDNKINSRNSWNFALIDYFHDLNVLKDEEDNINFQKASATLDGCVKIYSHRVDSVATETGKLLSGLAERKKKQTNADGSGKDADGNEKGTDSDHEDSLEIDPLTGMPVAREDPEALAKKKRTYNRVLETTLVDFESIRVKDLAQNLSIDPLFKKALADFDEGGAKSLLINTLHVDNDLRVVFDATTTEHELEHQTNTSESISSGENSVRKNGNEEEVLTEAAEPRQQEEDGEEDNEDDDDGNDEVDHDISMISTPDTSVTLIEDDILDLGVKFLDFNTIEMSTICPSMDQLQSAVADIGKAKSFVEGVNEQSNNFLSEKDLQTLPEVDDGIESNYDLPPDDDADIIDGAGSINYDIQQSFHGSEHQGGASNYQNISQVEEKSFLDSSLINQELLSYFDVAIGQNWRGREHWKVRKIRENFKKDSSGKQVPESTNSADSNETTTEKKVPKKQFEINFFDIDEDIEEEIFASKKGFLEIPVKQRTNQTHFLLPDDYKFTTEKITKLFIKPDQKMSFFSHRKNGRNKLQGSLRYNDTDIKEGSNLPEIADEHFWAENYEIHEKEENDVQEYDNENAENVNNLSLEEDNGIDFNQAFEDEDLDMDTKEDILGTQGILSNNNKVTYSRTAKKVDVRKLKNNVWKSISNRLHVMKSEEQEEQEHRAEFQEEEEQQQQEKVTREVYDLKFTDIAQDIGKMYSSSAKADLSTSFCFICLLHLANEYGFSISDFDDYQDLKIEFPEKVVNAILSK